MTIIQAPANLNLTCLGCGVANLDTDACPDSDAHPGVKVGEWLVRSYCLDCCGCPDHSDTWTEQVTRDLNPDRTLFDALESERDLDAERLLAEYRQQQRD